MHVAGPRNEGHRDRKIKKFKVILDYISNSRTAKATRKHAYQKNKNKNHLGVIYINSIKHKSSIEMREEMQKLAEKRRITDSQE